MAGEKAPWMPLYGFDFFNDGLVRRMSRETRQIFLELLWHAWNEGGISRDLSEIANTVDMPPSEFEAHWVRIAPAWEPHPKLEDLLVNPRQEKERERRTRIADRNRKNGSGKSEPNEGPKRDPDRGPDAYPD